MKYNKKYKLTWAKDKGRWKKYYKGRQWYLGKGQSKDDYASYQAALDEWKTLKARIDQVEGETRPRQDALLKAIALREKIIAFAELEKDDATKLEVQKELDFLRNQIGKATLEPYQDGMEPMGPPLLITNPSIQRCVFMQKAFELKQAAEWQTKATAVDYHKKWLGTDQSGGKKVVDLIDEYIQERQTLADSGQITKTRFRTNKEWLNRFKAWLGDGVMLSDFNGKHLKGFHSFLLDQITQGKYAANTAHAILADAKTFVRWLASVEYIQDVPKCMSMKKGLEIKKDKKTPPHLTIDEIKTILPTITNPKARLYFLLGLNCGYTAEEIATIKQSEVDWEQGRIIRKRNKTKDQNSVPVVNYKLWDETFALLKHFRSNEDDVIVNYRGGKKNTNLHITHTLRPIFEDFGKGFPKILRKTSATHIYRNPEYRGFHQLFLGHSFGTVAQTNYVSDEDKALDPVLKWLGGEYGVDSWDGSIAVGNCKDSGCPNKTLTPDAIGMKRDKMKTLLTRNTPNDLM